MNEESDALAEARFPLPDKTVLACVISANNALRQATFGQWRFSELHPGAQVVCGIFHELIVKEFSTLQGWRAGVPKQEPDVASEADPQESFEVKTSSSLSGIASNRYSWTNEAYDPDLYYTCVNFDARDLTLFRVRVGFIRRKAWRPQRGRGNVAMLKREALENLHECYGGFLLDAPVKSLPGFGEVTANTLANDGIRTIGGLLSNFTRVQHALSGRQAGSVLDYAQTLQANGVEINLSQTDLLQ